MGKTLVAIFDDYRSAYHALEAMIGSGFDRRSIRLALPEDSNTVIASESDTEESIGDNVGRFFALGNQHETYLEALRRGSYVLTIEVASDTDGDRAEDIIDQHNPVDIDEREAEWRDSGWQMSQERPEALETPFFYDYLPIRERTT